ncbi:putative hydrolase [uncultured Desulfobacterium sp.]|uniref:Putative hydrolase n=1 Tax=uncultured Desulfobacterium sp. TaxID=201089 RepID=A0A445MYZ9_9BACT|nr:putative hydrolase [uncultured Desulfobacterium sp.]
MINFYLFLILATMTAIIAKAGINSRQEPSAKGVERHMTSTPRYIGRQGTDFQQTEGVAYSADGTPIGFVKLGSGPSLIIVHGSLSTGREWLPVAAAIADRFTCYLMDRRGRGLSGDSGEYSLEKELDDIKAILDLAGSSPYLLGHSYGAICALEAANRFSVSKLVLYEPPIPVHSPVLGPELNDCLSAAERNQLDEALAIGLRGLLKMSEREVAALRRMPMWAEMTALTPTWIRELEVLKRLEFGVARFVTIVSPTLLLIGTVNPPHHIEASRVLEQILPRARLVELVGHSHQGHLTATAKFAHAVAKFLSESY